MATATLPPPATAAGPRPIPDAVIEAIGNSFVTILGKICGATATRRQVAGLPDDRPSVAAILSLVGDVPYSLTWLLTDESAPAVAKKFAGFDIPFASADMGDVVGELVNVVAGEVVAQLQKRRMAYRMSLPTVLRGQGMHMFPEPGPATHCLEFSVPQGKMYLQVTAPRGSAFVRMPGV